MAVREGAELAFWAHVCCAAQKDAITRTLMTFAVL
jgi:hypothetical protein